MEKIPQRSWLFCTQFIFVYLFTYLTNSLTTYFSSVCLAKWMRDNILRFTWLQIPSLPGAMPQQTNFSRLLTIPNSLGSKKIPDSSNRQPRKTEEVTKVPEFSHKQYFFCLFNPVPVNEYMLMSTHLNLSTY